MAISSIFVLLVGAGMVAFGIHMARRRAVLAVVGGCCKPACSDRIAASA